MGMISVCYNWMTLPAIASSPLVNPPQYHYYNSKTTTTTTTTTTYSSPKVWNQHRGNTFTPFASQSGGGGLSLKSVFKSCKKCGGKGAIECPGCKGTGKNKKNGNIFERWKCFDCQGFGLQSCPVCGQGGLTPEQRGER